MGVGNYPQFLMTAKIEEASEIGMMLGDWDEAEYTPEGCPHPSSKTRTINGIHDRDYVEDSGAVSSQPNFRCASADVSDATNGAKMTIPNEYGTDVIYTIRGIEPGGLGLTYLLLEKD